MKKNKILLFTAVLVAAVALWYLFKQPAAEHSMPAMGANQATAVTTLVVSSEAVPMTMRLPGRTAAFSQAQVRPQVTGIIKQRLFEEGTMVEKDQPLYQLDDARYVANLKSAQANLSSAQANHKATLARYNRVQSLVEKQAVSQQDLDDVEAALDQAKAAIAVAQAAVDLEQINVDYSRVYAPLGGQIGKSNLTVGALVTASQAESLAVITQLDPMYVDLQISGEQAIHIQQALNQQASISVAVEAPTSQTPLVGSLAFSEVTVDPTSGAVAMRAVVENPDHLLLPGLFVHAHVNLGEQQAILVPQRATTRTPQGDLVVWVVDAQQQVSQRQLQVSRAQGDQWVVSSGLSDGEPIVVEGYQRLTPGAKVVASPWLSSTDSPSTGE